MRTAPHDIWDASLVAATGSTGEEINALRIIAATDDAAELRRIAKNARDRSDVVGRAALRRLAAVSSNHPPGTVEHDCWAMVHAVEQLRRMDGRSVARMNRMRPMIERDGEVAALERCALKETAGFVELIGYGMPELTAEAIVLRHPGRFGSKAVAVAQARLQAAGVHTSAPTSAEGAGAVDC